MSASLFKKKDVDMTVGSIPKLIFGFFVPMVAGLFLQQLYNAVDMIIVGQFASAQSMAAVGGTGSITNTFVLLCSGISIGAGVIVSQYYGKHDSENIKKAVSSSVLLGLILSAIMTVLGISFTKPLLNLMKSNDDIIGYATTYLLIYFGGVSGLIMYNMLTSIFRAVGDSTRPLIYLIISSIINIVLDLLFVAVFKWDVIGAGVATIVAQFVSAGCAFVYLTRLDTDYKIDLKNLKMDKRITKNILLVGLPAGIQSSITGFSNTFLQSYINAFGSNYEAGYSVFLKIEHFTTVIQTSFGYAITSFVGQNVGANKIKRACKGVVFTLFASVLFTTVLIVPTVIFARPLSMAFTTDIGVVEASVYILTLISPLQVFQSINTTFISALRGIKKTKTSMFINVGSFVALRQIYLLVISAVLPNNIMVVLLSFPIGWFVACICQMIAWFASPLSKANRILIKHPEAKGLSVKELLEWKKNGFPELEK